MRARNLFILGICALGQSACDEQDSNSSDGSRCKGPCDALAIDDTTLSDDYCLADDKVCACRARPGEGESWAVNDCSQECDAGKIGQCVIDPHHWSGTVGGQDYFSAYGSCACHEVDGGSSNFLIWCEASAGLCWQEPPFFEPLNFTEATAFCEDFDLGGYNDWRIPNIDELRSLIRGCAVNEPPGACGVTAQAPACLDPGCSNTCGECSENAGPAAGGCYWDVALSNRCSNPLWSSSPLGTSLDSHWLIHFAIAGLMSHGTTDSTNLVRCVRTGP